MTVQKQLFNSFLNLIMLGCVTWFIGTTLIILLYHRLWECLWITIKTSKLLRLKVCDDIKTEHFKLYHSYYSLVLWYNLSECVSMGFSLYNVAEQIITFVSTQWFYILRNVFWMYGSE